MFKYAFVENISCILYLLHTEKTNLIDPTFYMTLKILWLFNVVICWPNGFHIYSIMNLVTNKVWNVFWEFWPYLSPSNRLQVAQRGFLVCRTFIFKPVLAISFSLFSLQNSLYEVCQQILYGPYILYVIQDSVSKWGQHLKFWWGFFFFDSFWNFLLAFCKQIWSS